MLEASSSGLPLLVGAASGSARFVVEGETGLVVRGDGADDVGRRHRRAGVAIRTRLEAMRRAAHAWSLTHVPSWEQVLAEDLRRPSPRVRLLGRRAPGGCRLGRRARSSAWTAPCRAPSRSAVPPTGSDPRRDSGSCRSLSTAADRISRGDGLARRTARYTGARDERRTGRSQGPRRRDAVRRPARRPRCSATSAPTSSRSSTRRATRSRSHGASKDGVGLWWKVVGRNKRAITLYLGSPRGPGGVPSAGRATPTSSSRTSAPARSSAGASATRSCSRINPRLVLARVTGFGQIGPYAGRPGFGTLAEAMSGFAAITGEPDGPPTLPPFGLADGIAALAAAFATMTALRARETHRGGARSSTSPSSSRS